MLFVSLPFEVVHRTGVCLFVVSAGSVEKALLGTALFMKALRNPGTVRDARGEWKIDEYGNPVMTMFIRKVERKDGKLVNTVVKSYPNTSQFWTYDPKAFLAAPVYSRDSPPARNLEP